MKVLGLDTAHKFLVVSLIEDGAVLASYEKEANRQQSELALPVIDELFKEVGWNPLVLDAIVITVGPGSYTGLRIAMTIAKVYCTNQNIPLYTLSTLQLYAGLARKNVVMDARGKRAYLGCYEKGVALSDEAIIDLSELQPLYDNNTSEFCGDLSLLGGEDTYPNISSHFWALKEHWVLVKEPHLLTPNYLKQQKEYSRNHD